MSTFEHLHNVLDDKNGEVWSFTATEEQRQFLAKRFQLISIQNFTGSAHIEPWGKDFKLTAHYEAEVEQPCVITGEAVPEALAETFEVVIHIGEEPMHEELDEEEMISGDDIEYTLDGAVDLAEIFAQYLATGLNPFPRAEGVDISQLSAQGIEIMDENQAKELSNPFAALKGLKE